MQKLLYHILLEINYDLGKLNGFEVVQTNEEGRKNIDFSWGLKWTSQPQAYTIYRSLQVLHLLRNSLILLPWRLCFSAFKQTKHETNIKCQPNNYFVPKLHVKINNKRDLLTKLTQPSIFCFLLIINSSFILSFTLLIYI